MILTYHVDMYFSSPYLGEHWVTGFATKFTISDFEWVKETLSNPFDIMTKTIRFFDVCRSQEYSTLDVTLSIDFVDR